MQGNVFCSHVVLHYWVFFGDFVDWQQAARQHKAELQMEIEASKTATQIKDTFTATFPSI